MLRVFVFFDKYSHTRRCCCLLFVVCRVLFVVCCLLAVVCCLLSVVCCLLFAVCCVLVTGVIVVYAVSERRAGRRLQYRARTGRARAFVVPIG